MDQFRRYPFIHNEAEVYVTAINILAVEYLIKTDNKEEYIRRVEQVSGLTDYELTYLWVELSLNMHTSSLGAMITHGDYEHQKENLLNFLDRHKDEESI